MYKSVYLLTALILFLFINNLNATTYYVDNKGGNDGNSGTSASSPWNSISKVNSTSFHSGDIISFKCGDRFNDASLFPYCDGLTFNSYGTGAKPVIDGAGRSDCLHMGSDNPRNYVTIVGLKFVNAVTNVNMYGCTHITFESCNIDSSAEAAADHSNHNNIYSGLGSYLTIRNSTMSYSRAANGIYIDGTDNALMEYDTLLYNLHSGFRVAFGDDKAMTTGLVIRYCVVKTSNYDCIDDDGSDGAEFYYNLFETTNIAIYLFTDGSGLYDAYAARNSSYYNNTFINHGSEATVHLNSSTGIMNGMAFKNNIFYADNSSSYYFYEEVNGNMGTWTFTNNIYYMTSGSPHGWYRHGVTYSTLSQWQSLGYDPNSFNTDPQFNNYPARDLSLKTGSKAISTGIGVGLTADIMGTPVPSTNPDMGIIQHTSSAMPVELTSFTGTLINNSVHLAWNTATELDNQGFVIQRNSNSSWEDIGFVAGKGNSVTKNDYSFDDKNPVGYKIQYRLKQVDNNGSYKYSDVFSVTIAPESFSIGNYPNPFNPSTKIRYTIPAQSMINLEVYNIIGEKIDVLKNEMQQPGTYEINWSGSNHPSGIYLLSLVESPADGSTKISKTIKMNLIK
jgi:hypothetical protein